MAGQWARARNKRDSEKQPRPRSDKGPVIDSSAAASLH